MSKVRNFSEIAPNIAFPESNFYDLYRLTFEKSDLAGLDIPADSRPPELDLL